VTCLLQSKIAGMEWKGLDADGKAKYEAMAKADKERYKKEMADYTPAKSPSDGKKATKKKKDPNAPKGAKSAYIYFSNEQRVKLKEKNPDMSFGEVAKKIGELYKALSPEEKKKYEAMAEADKKRFQKATAEYESKKKAEDDGVDDSSDDDRDDGSDNSDDD